MFGEQIRVMRANLLQELRENTVANLFKDEKTAQRGIFWDGYPGVIRVDIPAQNFSQGGQNPGKTSIWARISMTQRRGRPRPQGIPKNFGQKNFGMNVCSLFNT